MMSKSSLILGAAFTSFAAATICAQTTPQPAGGRATTGVVATVAATGCIERWTSPGDAVGAPDGEQAPAGVQYVLTQVEGATASATAAGAGKSESTPRQTRYLLLPSPAMDYAPHLHHKVKIAGTIAPQPSEGAAPETRAVDPTSRETNLPDRKSAAYDDNLLEVASLTMVARSCGKQ